MKTAVPPPHAASPWNGRLLQGDWFRLLPSTGALLCGIGLTIVFQRYTLLSLFDLVQADPGDSRLTASVLEHWFKVFQGMDHWRSPPWFFPKQGTLGYSDVLLGMALPYSAFRALGAGTFVAMNLMLVLLSLLSYLACLWLLRGVLAFRWLASAAGAAFFTFNYPKFAQLPHGQLRFDMLQPIILGLLLSLLISRELPSNLRTFLSCLGAALAFALLAGTTFLYAWFLALVLLLFLALALVIPDLRLRLLSRLRRRWPAACAGLFLGGYALLPVLSLYLSAIAETGPWPWPDVLRNIPRPTQLIWMGTDNLVWGWLAARRPDLDGANWAEMRIGYGAGATLAWIALVAFSVMQLARRSPSSYAQKDELRDCVGAVVAALLIASFAIFLLAVQVRGHSPWYAAYKLFPGGMAVRSVSRHALALTLPMAIGFAYAVDRFLTKPQSRAASALVAATVLIVATEQLARVKEMYSAHEAEQFERTVANMVDRHCTAFYLKPTSKNELVGQGMGLVTEQTFDAKAYLAANPDVAQKWHGSAFEHFIKHGKSEDRSLSPVETPLSGHYQLTASLAALAAGVPTVNGISGKIPPGWDLMRVFAQNVGERVNRWLQRNREGRPVCLLERDLNGDEIPRRAPSGFFSK
jgi:hypothetical protein